MEAPSVPGRRHAYEPIWIGNRLDQLKQLWGAGLSASQIAWHLHTTRNAVLGAAHRNGLSDRKATPRKPVVDMRKHKRARSKVLAVPKPKPPRPQRPTIPPDIIPVAHPMHLTQLNGGNCRWVVGEPKDMMYCGAACESHGASFCAAHANVAYIPTRLNR